MINVLYCGNEFIFNGILLSSLSMAKVTKDSIHFYIFTANLTYLKESYKSITTKEAKYLEKCLKKYNKDNKVTLLDLSEDYKKYLEHSANNLTKYTPYTLLRLFMDVVPELPSKVLYIDADTLVKKDIGELYFIDINDVEFAGVRDFLGKFFIYPNYINAGVLLFNLDKCKETGLFAKCRELVDTKKMSYPDQDALNKLIIKKKFLHRRYNSQRMNHKDDVIRHYSKSFRLFPIFLIINVNLWNIEGMHKKLKDHTADKLLEEYKVLMKDYESVK